MTKMPPGMARKIAIHIFRNRLRREKRFPLVLMLEPLHACNFHCTGCGRIREYADTIREKLGVDECLAAVAEVDTPVVSICGGEPLIYPGIEHLVAELQKQGRYIYLCTNAWLVKKMMPKFKPDKHLIFNIHLDGLEATHDAVVEKPGSFQVAIEAIKALKEAGFYVCCNTTLYKQTDPDEVVGLFSYLQTLGIDGILLSPAYTYRMIDPDFFMQREEIKQRFMELAPRLRGMKLWNSPVFMKFVMGDLDLDCTPWGNPTRNTRGWRGPCYQVGDQHFQSFRQMLDEVDWERFVKRQDDRCASCMTHCGFEPTAALKGSGSLSGLMTMLGGW